MFRVSHVLGSALEHELQGFASAAVRIILVSSSMSVLFLSRQIKGKIFVTSQRALMVTS